MGHSRLGVLPKTRDWKAVVQLLREGAAVDEIATASAKAAEAAFQTSHEKKRWSAASGC